MEHIFGYYANSLLLSTLNKKLPIKVLKKYDISNPDSISEIEKFENSVKNNKLLGFAEVVLCINNNLINNFIEKIPVFKNRYNMDQRDSVYLNENSKNIGTVLQYLKKRTVPPEIPVSPISPLPPTFVFTSPLFPVSPIIDIPPISPVLVEPPVPISVPVPVPVPTLMAPTVLTIPDIKIDIETETEIDTDEHLCQLPIKNPPIYKETELTKDNGLLMHLRLNKQKQKQKRVMRGTVIYLPLLKWYLEHGFVIRAVYSVTQYEVSTHYKDILYDNILSATQDEHFYDSLSYIFENADDDYLTNDDLLMRDGGMIPLKYKNVTYEVECYDYQCYAVEHLARLRLLEFYHDFLSKYIDSNKIEIISVGSDNIYIGAKEDTLEQMVKPDMIKQFINERDNWLDDNTPGLFSVRFQGYITNNYDVRNFDINLNKIYFMWDKIKRIFVKYNKKMEKKYRYGVVIYTILVTE